jgi:hypothetical protein
MAEIVDLVIPFRVHPVDVPLLPGAPSVATVDPVPVSSVDDLAGSLMPWTVIDQQI